MQESMPPHTSLLAPYALNKYIGIAVAFGRFAVLSILPFTITHVNIVMCYVSARRTLNVQHNTFDSDVAKKVRIH